MLGIYSGRVRLRKQARDSLGAPAARYADGPPLNLSSTPRPSNQPPMVATDSCRKRNFRHFPNHLHRIPESHYQATWVLSPQRESGHIYLEWSHHETSGESTITINRMSPLGAGVSPPQLARTTSRRPDRQQRFRTPLREVGHSPEILFEITPQGSSALYAHSKGGEAC